MIRQKKQKKSVGNLNLYLIKKRIVSIYEIIFIHDEKGEWLKITYYDEDGADVSERFRLQTPAQRTAFEQLFIRPHTRTPGIPLRWITAADILAQQALLRHPDFVVARMKGQYWQVREKVFDYEGRFRLAHELRG